MMMHDIHIGQLGKRIQQWPGSARLNPRSIESHANG